MATGSPLPALKEMGHVEPTITGAVKVVLLNKIADWASAELANAVRRIGVYMSQMRPCRSLLVCYTSLGVSEELNGMKECTKRVTVSTLFITSSTAGRGGRNGIGGRKQKETTKRRAEVIYCRALREENVMR